MATSVLDGVKRVKNPQDYEFLFKGDAGAWHVTAQLDQYMRKHKNLTGILVCHLQPNLFGIYRPSRGWTLLSTEKWEEKHLTACPALVYMGGWAVLKCVKTKAGRIIRHHIAYHDLIHAIRSAAMKLPSMMERNG